MRRRQLLAALGSTIPLGLAGCAERSTGEPTTDGTPASTSDTPTKTDDGTPEPGTDEPFERITVGSRRGVAFPDNNRSRVIRIRNDATTARAMTITLRAAGEKRLQTDVEFPAGGWLRMVVTEPAAYTLEVAVAGSVAGTVSIPRSSFDCNASTTTVEVTPDGDLSTTTVSTEMACPGPAIVDRSFSAGRGTCGTGGDARVTFADGTVTVEGTVRAPDPCHGLELVSATLRNAEAYGDGTDDVLVVTVATTESQGGVCVQCVGAIPYTAGVSFEHAYPSNVRVVHRSMGEERTVRTVSR